MAMPRYAARRDGNHSQIAQRVREHGASWLDLSKVGDGCPDGAVGLLGETVLVEVKDPKQAPNKRRLRANQVEFVQTWRGGQCVKVETVDDVDTLIETIRQRRATR